MASHRTPGAAIEWSHGKARPTAQAAELTPPASGPSAPMNDPKTGRFMKGNGAHRYRLLRARAQGIATLNPAKVATWMRPYVEIGQSYVAALLGMLEGRPQLHPLAGDAADAHTMYRCLLTMALSTSGKDRVTLMGEARGWLREHRAALATLSALAGGMKLPEPDPHAVLEAAFAAEREAGSR